MRARFAGAVLVAWAASVSVDYLLQAGLLARLYEDPSPFLLAPEEAFRRIPLGYAAFLLLAGALAWLLLRLDAASAREGARVGAVAGALAWGALALGLASVTTAPARLLLAWTLAQTTALAVAGAFAGATLGGASAKRLGLALGALLAASLGATIALQTLGLAPAERA